MTTHRPPPEVPAFSLASGLLLFVPIALLGNELGSAFRYQEISAAIFYLPYAALTAALVISPLRHWPWYIASGVIAHFVSHWPEHSVSWMVLADVANAVRGVGGALLIRRAFGGPPRLGGIRALMLFVLIAVLIAPAIGATLGAANFILHGISPSYWRPWLAWFLSNALTGLALLPALVVPFAAGASWHLRRVGWKRITEGFVLAGALAVTCWFAFRFGGTGAWHPALPFYAPLPVLLWAALRFGPGGASLAVTVAAFSATLAADQGTGPFLDSSVDENILTVQLFVLLTSLPVLCIAAVNGARQGVVQLHRALLASLQDHVAILDARGKVIDVTESWRRSAETPGAHPIHRADAGDDYLAICRSVAVQGDGIARRALAGVTAVLGRDQRIFEMEYDTDRFGHRQWYVTSVEALERAEGGAVIMRTEITARRQGQIELEEQRRALSHLSRVAVLGELSGALAHELSQPLTAIYSNAEAARHLLRREPADVAEVGTILRDIVAEDRRASQVIDRLRALLKRGETRRQPLDAGELIADVLGIAHAELVTRHISSRTFVEPGLPPVLGDRVQLQQVLLNLIINACEAMASGGTREPRLFIGARADRDRTKVHLSVRDNGVGIPPDLLSRLFEPFVSTKEQGLGIGLSISRTIVATHGGHLWAENNPEGGGATLHCLLAAVERPALADPPDPDPLASTTPLAVPPLVTAPSIPLGGPRVLTPPAASR